MAIKGGFNVPFNEAVSFFENKLKLPTASYTDIWREQHSHAFVVAGAQTDALVEDFYNALHSAMTAGTGLKAFQADFDTIVAKHGWSYHGTPGWRSKLIYDTNIRQAYNAGQYSQMQAVAHLRPYWQYVHVSITNPRPAHVHLDGLIIAADDPFWNYYMPQNGYNCQCKVNSLSRSEASDIWTKAGKSGPDTAPPLEWEEKTVGTTGSNPRTVMTPKGIDPGFAYNPGKAWLEPMTVPRLTGYDAVLAERKAAFPAGTVRPPLPVATVVKPALLLPASTAPAVAVEDFLNVFGADLEQGAVFEDAVGTPVVITKRLFADESGSFAALDEKQIQSMNLLAMALIEPDEIWWHWEQDSGNPDLLPDTVGRWRLKRRYLRTFKIAGQAQAAVTAFEWSRSKGWTGSTALMQSFESDVEKSLDTLRVGRLVYAKEKK